MNKSGFLSALFITLVLVSMLPTMAFINVARGAESSNNNKWHLIVMPFFLQKDLSGEYGLQGVFLYAYGHIEAVIDLNHNGRPDPGEPVINETEKNKVIYLLIGKSNRYYDPYVEINKDIGPLWILTKTPLLASELVNKDGRYIGAYNMPPPGTSFTIPNLPGTLYISAASPEETHVVVNKTGEGVYDYTLIPGETLVINTKGRVIHIESDKPVAIMLMGEPVNRTDVYMTEIIPNDRLAMSIDAPLAIPSSPYIERAGMKPFNTYSIVVLQNGSVVWINNTASGNIGYSFDPENALMLSSKDNRAVQYALMVSKYGGIAVTPVYNFGFWREYFGAPALTWFFSYGITKSTVVSAVELVPSGVLYSPEEDYYIIRLTSRRHVNYGPVNADIEFVPYSHRWNSHPFILHPNLSKKYWVVRGFYPTSVAPVFIYAYSAMDSIILRTGGIPIPPSEMPAVIHDVIYTNNSYIMGISSVGSFSYWPVLYIKSNYDSFNYTFRAWEGRIECNKLPEGIAAILDEKFHSVSFLYTSKLNNCKIEVKTSVKPYHNFSFYNFVMFKKGDKAKAPVLWQVLILPKNIKTSIINKTINIPVKEETEAILEPPATPQYQLVEAYITRPPLLPVTNLTVLLDNFGINLSKITQPTPTPTPSPTTITPPGTTTPSTTTSPGSGGITGSETTPTATTKRTTETTTSGALPVRSGDKLTYKVKVDAKGGGEKIKDEGKVTLVAHVKGGRIYFKVVENTLSSNASGIAIVGFMVSELFYYIGAPVPLQNLSTNLGIHYGKCPIISPTRGDKEVRGETPISEALMNAKAKYVCKYSKGVLVYSKADIQGEYEGKEFTINLEASLVNTTIPGVKPYGAERGGAISSIALVGAGIVALAAVIAVLLLKRR